MNNRRFVYESEETISVESTQTSTFKSEFPKHKGSKFFVVVDGENQVSGIYNRQRNDRYTEENNSGKFVRKEKETFSQEETTKVEQKLRIANLKQIRNDLISWIETTEESIKCLRLLAEEIGVILKDTSKVKIGGSAASIAGGIVSAVGFGLSFVTFGTSLILAIAGGVVAGAGGATLSGRSIRDNIMTKSGRKQSSEIVKKYNEQLARVKRNCIDIFDDFDQSLIDTLLPEWVQFWLNICFDASSLTKNVGWSVIGSTILKSLDISENFAGGASSVGKSAFHAAGTFGRIIHIAGGVAGIICLPLDIHTLVNSAIDVAHGNIPEIAKTIRNVADKMEKACPTVEDVDKMIECTIVRLENYSRKSACQDKKTNYCNTTHIECDIVL